jgi:hypothetical protein
MRYNRLGWRRIRKDSGDGYLDDTGMKYSFPIFYNKLNNIKMQVWGNDYSSFLNKLAK